MAQMELCFNPKFRAQRNFRRICITAWYLREPGPKRHDWSDVLKFLNKRGIKFF